MGVEAHLVRACATRKFRLFLGTDRGNDPCPAALGNLREKQPHPTRSSMEGIPQPEDGDILTVLPKFLDLPEDEFRLALSWLMSLFQPDGRCAAPRVGYSPTAWFGSKT